MNWQPSKKYATVAEANRLYYEKNADLYQSTECCVVSDYLQNRLDAFLNEIDDMFASKLTTISALDACGGTGNVSLKLLKKGYEVTLCDISPDLIAYFEVQADKINVNGSTVCQEIGSFLAESDQEFDLIVFSSALHHLENIEAILQLAYQRLKPNGLLFSIFDPTLKSERSAAGKFIVWLDYVFFKLFAQTSDFLSAVSRKIVRKISQLVGIQNSELSTANLGVTAEYHVQHGINDTQLASSAEDIGYEIVWHRHFSDARYSITREMLDFIGVNTSFSLLLRKK